MCCVVFINFSNSEAKLEDGLANVLEQEIFAMAHKAKPAIAGNRAMIGARQDFEYTASCEERILRINLNLRGSSFMLFVV